MLLQVCNSAAKWVCCNLWHNNVVLPTIGRLSIYVGYAWQVGID